MIQEHVAQKTHDCDGLALYLRQLVRAIHADGILSKRNQYRTGELRELPLFKAAEDALESAHNSFRYREQLEAVAVAAAHVLLNTPRAQLPETTRACLSHLNEALDTVEPGWRDAPRFWRLGTSTSQEASR